MSEKVFFKTSLYFTGIVTIAIWSLLAWNHYHGGVPSHHILHREDLPAISNWWGGLLLPLLTWFLLYRIQKRLMRDNVEKSKVSKPREIYFMGSLVLYFLEYYFLSFLLLAILIFRDTCLPDFFYLHCSFRFIGQSACLALSLV